MSVSSPLGGWFCVQSSGDLGPQGPTRIVLGEQHPLEEGASVGEPGGAAGDPMGLRAGPGPFLGAPPAGSTAHTCPGEVQSPRAPDTWVEEMWVRKQWVREVSSWEILAPQHLHLPPHPKVLKPRRGCKGRSHVAAGCWPCRTHYPGREIRLSGFATRGPELFVLNARPTFPTVSLAVKTKTNQMPINTFMNERKCILRELCADTQLP